jgi:NTP pyrophosphatase (non-canonical NTP hydrolase)
MNNKDELRRARDYITAKLPQGELLAQLAEEAVELAHAALKLRRSIEATNYTPVDVPTAVAATREEIADVWLLIQILKLDAIPSDLEDTMRRKLLRWESRLKERGVAK